MIFIHCLFIATFDFMKGCMRPTGHMFDMTAANELVIGW